MVCAWFTLSRQMESVRILLLYEIVTSEIKVHREEQEKAFEFCTCVKVRTEPINVWSVAVYPPLLSIRHFGETMVGWVIMKAVTCHH